MNTLLTLGLLCSLAGTSLGLKCWNSDGYKNMRDTNVVSELNCPSDANKSCSKEWYKVVSWGDIYYKLGCSSNDPKAETEEKKGPGGEMGSTSRKTLALRTT